MSAFENALRTVPDSRKRQAIVDVVDTLRLCLYWFREHDVSPTASDLLRTAEMIFMKEDESDGDT